MVEGARLESVYTGNRIVGSNPTPSAKTNITPNLIPTPKPLRKKPSGAERQERVDP